MQEGTIIRLNNGFGFIKMVDKENDLFFHSNELQNVKFEELHEGDKLTFEVADSPKGGGKQNAVKVSRV